MAMAVVQFSDFVILANNFGQTRPRLDPTGVAESSQAANGREVLATNGLVTDELFGQFADELELDKML